jgi:hypothetical protein
VTPETRAVITGTAAAVLFAGVVGLAGVRLRTSSELHIQAVELGAPAGRPDGTAGHAAPLPGGTLEQADAPTLRVTSIIQYHSTGDYPAREPHRDRRE